MNLDKIDKTDIYQCIVYMYSDKTDIYIAYQIDKCKYSDKTGICTPYLCIAYTNLDMTHIHNLQH